MMIDHRTAVLGRTGLNVSRLGLGSSYGPSAADVEYAFERGVNFFMYAMMRRAGFGEGLRNVCRKARDRVIVEMGSFIPFASLAQRSVMAGLKGLGLDHADMLLLGHWQKRPPGRILDMAVKLRERGLFRHIAISTHTRRLAAELANEPASPFDIVQIRYNASHRGAEAEVFPRLPSEGCPGVIAFTATGPRKLLRRPWGLPASDPTPTSTDCYRFVLSNPRVDLCVAGPKNRAHLDLALAALDKGPLSESEMAWMRRVGDLVHRKLPI